MGDEMRYLISDFYIYIIAILLFLLSFYAAINRIKFCREKIKINQHICFLYSLSAPPISCSPVSPPTLLFADSFVSEGALLAGYSPYYPYYPYHHICFSQDYAQQKFLFCYNFETRYTFFVPHEVFESLD